MQVIYCCSSKGKPLLCRDCDKNFNMSQRGKGRKMVPADYDDADLSDSDIFNDPDYVLPEPPAPKLSQDNGCATYKKRLRENPKNSQATPKSTQGGQGAPVTPLSGTSDAGTRKRARDQKLKGQIATVKAAQNKLQARRAARAHLAEGAQIEEGLEGKTDCISTSSHEEEDAVTETPGKRTYNRKKAPSIIWHHVIHDKSKKLIQCSYCEKKWHGLCGSTSNPLKHLREMHYERLSFRKIYRYRA